jgi:hypothetical protein
MNSFLNLLANFWVDFRVHVKPDNSGFICSFDDDNGLKVDVEISSEESVRPIDELVTLKFKPALESIL